MIKNLKSNIYFYIYLIFKNINQLKNIAKDTLMKN